MGYGDSGGGKETSSWFRILGDRLHGNGGDRGVAGWSENWQVIPRIPEHSEVNFGE
jgi:hypothetical protein